MTRLLTLWHEIIDSLWFVPALCTLTGAALAGVLVQSNDTLLGALDPETLWWAFGGSAEGAQGVLSAIGGSIITVTGVVFSVTIVALQLASSQFTPRILRQFTADRANQLVLGVFIGTFTFTLLVQRTVRSGNGEEEFVPHLAVTGAVVLALTSIGFLIFFINHAARSIQASVIIDSVTTDTLKVMREIFPEHVGDGGEARAATAEDYSEGREDEARRVLARRAGYVQAIDRGELKQIALTKQLLIRMEVEVGQHILPGQEIMTLWPGSDVPDDLDGRLCGTLVLGLERTPHQDVKLGVIELMDMAVKAMSPGVNDPTTAMHAVDRLGELLLEMSWRRRGDRIELSRDGRPLLLVRRPTLSDTAELAFNQIRHYSAENPTVSIALMRKLAELAALSPDEARPIFVRQLNAVHDAALRVIADPLDRERVRTAGARAMSRASEPLVNRA